MSKMPAASAPMIDSSPAKHSAAVTSAKARALPAPDNPSSSKQARWLGSPVPPPTVPTMTLAWSPRHRDRCLWSPFWSHQPPTQQHRQHLAHRRCTARQAIGKMPLNADGTTLNATKSRHSPIVLHSRGCGVQDFLESAHRAAAPRR